MSNFNIFDMMNESATKKPNNSISSKTDVKDDVRTEQSAQDDSGHKRKRPAPRTSRVKMGGARSTGLLDDEEWAPVPVPALPTRKSARLAGVSPSGIVPIPTAPTPPVPKTPSPTKGGPATKTADLSISVDLPADVPTTRPSYKPPTPTRITTAVNRFENTLFASQLNKSAGGPKIKYKKITPSAVKPAPAASASSPSNPTLSTARSSFMPSFEKAKLSPGTLEPFPITPTIDVPISSKELSKTISPLHDSPTHHPNGKRRVRFSDQPAKVKIFDRDDDDEDPEHPHQNIITETMRKEVDLKHVEMMIEHGDKLTSFLAEGRAPAPTNRDPRLRKMGKTPPQAKVENVKEFRKWVLKLCILDPPEDEEEVPFTAGKDSREKSREQRRQSSTLEAVFFEGMVLPNPSEPNKEYFDLRENEVPKVIPHVDENGSEQIKYCGPFEIKKPEVKAPPPPEDPVAQQFREPQMPPLKNKMATANTDGSQTASDNSDSDGKGPISDAGLSPTLAKLMAAMKQNEEPPPPEPDPPKRSQGILPEPTGQNQALPKVTPPIPLSIAMELAARGLPPPVFNAVTPIPGPRGSNLPSTTGPQMPSPHDDGSAGGKKIRFRLSNAPKVSGPKIQAPGLVQVPVRQIRPSVKDAFPQAQSSPTGSKPSAESNKAAPLIGGETGAVVGGPPAQDKDPESTVDRPKNCPYFAEGSCKWKDKCRFFHDVNQAPANYKPSNTTGEGGEARYWRRETDNRSSQQRTNDRWTDRGSRPYDSNDRRRDHQRDRRDNDHHHQQNSYKSRFGGGGYHHGSSRDYRRRRDSDSYRRRSRDKDDNDEDDPFKSGNVLEEEQKRRQDLDTGNTSTSDSHQSTTDSGKDKKVDDGDDPFKSGGGGEGDANSNQRRDDRQQRRSRFDDRSHHHHRPNHPHHQSTENADDDDPFASGPPLSKSE